MPAFLEILVFRFYFLSKKTKDFIPYLIFGWFGQTFFSGVIHVVFFEHELKTFTAIVKELFLGPITIIYLIEQFPQLFVAVLGTIFLIKASDHRRH
ncbi:MAG: hypothetical protein V1716_01215 [Candidatus Uhrbacteria bacterium]